MRTHLRAPSSPPRGLLTLPFLVHLQLVPVAGRASTRGVDLEYEVRSRKRALPAAATDPRTRAHHRVSSLHACHTHPGVLFTCVYAHVYACDDGPLLKRAAPRRAVLPV
jgi:hypothetical protein